MMIGKKYLFNFLKFLVYAVVYHLELRSNNCKDERNRSHQHCPPEVTLLLRFMVVTEQGVGGGRVEGERQFVGGRWLRWILINK